MGIYVLVFLGPITNREVDETYSQLAYVYKKTARLVSTMAVLF